MTYNEWRDELYNNLLSVPDSERRRVLDYYAEAYADRREAGFSERQIINDFGAPYDAAQRILHENDDESTSNVQNSTHFEDSRRTYEQPQSEVKAEKHGNYTWVFVLLCIIFAGPLFGLIMTMVGVTIGLFFAPFGLVASGAGSLAVGIVHAFTNVGAGFVQIGFGLIQMGVGIALFSLSGWLIRGMWKLFRKVFGWIKGLFSGKEGAQ